MQKQAFREETAPPAPRYDSDTVRQGQGRGSGINAETTGEARIPERTTEVRIPFLQNQTVRGLLPLVSTVLLIYPFFKQTENIDLDKNPLILTFFLLAVFLPLTYSGWTLKDMRYVVFGGIYLTALGLLTTTPGGGVQSWDGPLLLGSLAIFIIGVVVFMFSVLARLCFDRMTRRSDR